MRRKNKKKKHHVDESWLLPYSDLMTLLLALFIVLFAMSQIDVEKYNKLSHVLKSEFTGGDGILDHYDSPIDIPVEEADEDEQKKDDESNSTKELAQLQTLQKKINAYIDKNHLAEVFGTKLTDEGLLITILNDVTFDSGSASVKEDGKKIAKELSKLLNTDPPRQIVISGHTDDRPIRNSNFGSNWELSVMRAINFMAIILENDNLDPTKFSAKGYGEHHPIVPNTNKVNRAKNRRVEVLVLPNYDLNMSKKDK